MTARRPLIGLTSSETFELETSTIPRHGVPVTYQHAVEQASGVPVLLSACDPGQAAEQVAHLSGLVLCGGPDVEPARYGADRHPAVGFVDPDMDAHELAVLAAADAAGLPLLAVCRGMQLLNVVRGGTLHQHLPDLGDGMFEHKPLHKSHRPEHPVTITAGSLLGRLTGAERVCVNTYHHQAIDRLGDRLTVSAVSDDGVIEAVEDPDRTFTVDVQWHPESLSDRREHAALFDALVACAAG